MTQALWYLSRATGIVSLLLLTASVVIGVLTSVRWATPRWPRFVTASLHGNISLLVLLLLGLHILTAVLDPYAPIHLVDVLIPFVSAYRPLWLGLGTLAFDLLLALAATSLLRARIGHRSWRVVHWTAYACWPIAVVHGLGTGSDTRTSWVLAVTALCTVAVVAAVGVRVVTARRGRPLVRVGLGLAALALPLALAGWALAGPLQPGWARRAGTPPGLLASSATGATRSGGTGTSSGSSAPPQVASSALPALPFTAAVQGSLTQSGTDPVTVRIQLMLATGSGVPLEITLRGAAQPGGGVQLADGRVRLGTPDGEWSGEVTGLDGNTVQAVLSHGERTLNLRVDLTLNGGSVGGTATATARGDE